MRDPWRRWGLLVVLGLGLAACNAPPPPRTTVNILSDKFSKTVTLEGIPQLDPNNGDGLFWMLRSIIDPQTGAVQHQIYVEWTYAGPFMGRYFAADDTARPLPVTLVRKEACPFGRCDRVDTIVIAISDSTLRARATTGFEVKLSSRVGPSGILSFTPQMISAQLEAENRILPGITASTASGGTPSSGPVAMLGISFMTVSASQINPIIYPDGGLFIVVVTPDSPAAKAGIKAGDVLVAFDGKPISDPTTAREIIAGAKPGSAVKLDIMRGKQRMALQAQL